MPYKDTDKQKEANRQAKARQRAKQGMTKGVTSEGMTVSSSDTHVIPSKARTDQPQASDPEVQAIWDRRNAQGQPSMDGQPVAQTKYAFSGEGVGIGMDSGSEK